MRGVIFVLAALVAGCGSRKLAMEGERRDLGMVEETERSVERSWTGVDAESLARALREMEWEFRRVEERDSAGNERVTTEGVGRLREEEERRDSVGMVEADTTARTVDVSGVTDRRSEVVVDEEKESAAREWKWIVWGIVALVMVIVVGRMVYKLRK